MIVKPLVSILIPCFNAGPFLAECLDSALAQSYCHTEILAIDDGSSDDTWEVLRKYSKQVRSFRFPDNTGVSSARNFLLYESKGEYIHFQDADDLMHPDFLEVMLPLLLGTEFQAALCNVDYFTGYDQDKLIGQWLVRCRLEGEGYLTYMIHVGGQAINSLYQRRALLEVRGFREEIKFAEDYDLHLRLAEVGTRFINIDRSLLKKRQKPQDIFLRLEKETMAASGKVLSDLYKRLKISSVDEPLDVYAVIADHLWYIGRIVSDSGRINEGIDCLRLSEQIGRRYKVPASFLYGILTRVLGIRRTEILRFYWRLTRRFFGLRDKE